MVSLSNQTSPRARAWRDLRQAVSDGRLLAGEALPREDELAVRLGVSRTTIRAVLVQAEQSGLVRRDGRLRRVAGATASTTGSAWMVETCVLLTREYGAPGDGAIRSGWAWGVYAGALRALGQAGGILVTLGPDQRQSWEAVLADRPRGVVVLRDVVDGQLDEALAGRLRALPAVAVQGDLPLCRFFDRVESDHAAGAAALVRWLAARGCRRIRRLWCFAPGPRSYDDWLARRDSGYTAACAELGLAVDPPLHGLLPPPSGDLADDVELRVRTLVGYLAPLLAGEAAPDALMCPSDHSAQATVAALRTLGRSDLTVVGYDAYVEAATADRPAATVDKDNAAIGAALVALLGERLAGRLPPEPQLRLVQPRLIVHGA